MNTALVTVAQRLIDQQMQYLVSAEDAAQLIANGDMGQIQQHHNARMLEIIAPLQAMIAIHSDDDGSEDGGSESEERLIAFIVEFQDELANELVLWTEEIVESKTAA